MNEMQKMKLKVSRAAPPPGGGGSGDNGEYDRYDRTKNPNLSQAPTLNWGLTNFMEIKEQLSEYGFPVEKLCRSKLKEPFEPEAFELFLLRLMSCIHNFADDIGKLKEEVQALKNKG